MSRANPFGDLDDFAPQGAPKPVPAAAIEEISATSGFPSRKAARSSAASAASEAASPSPAPAEAPSPVSAPVSPPVPGRRPRRRTTGRNQQINIKATEETITRLYRIADALDLPLGAVLEQALEALESASSEG